MLFDDCGGALLRCYSNSGVDTANLLIRGAKQLLTLHGPRTPRRGPAMNEVGVIQDGAALISDGVLREIGPTRRVENLSEARTAAEINAAGRLVMPGFIDSHTHLAFPPPNAADEERDNAQRALTADTGKRTAARWLAYLESMARHGTTTVEIKTGAGPNEDAERKLLRVLSIVQRGPVDIVPTFLLRLPRRDVMGEAATAEYARHLLEEFLPRVRQKQLARFADLAWDNEQSHQSLFDRYLGAARLAGFPCKVHADGVQSAAAIAMAVRNLALSVDHLEHATASEVAMLSGMPTMATVLPLASLHSGEANAPARALVDAGVPIALGTDFNARHTPTLNMQTVISLACMRMGLTPAEAISAVTINAAHALGCAARAGSLETRKDADIAILNISDYRDLANNIGTNMVHITIKRGTIIYREGNVVAPGGGKVIGGDDELD